VKRPKNPRYERYELDVSPWAQNPTQRDVAALLGMTRGQAEALIRDKELFVHRRPEVIAGKQRQLAVPVRKLRGVHDRLKFHFNKIKQPEYLYSPRKGYSQRDNAALHAGSLHVLQLDIRQFYPRTTQEDIWRWCFHRNGMYEDVAGLVAKIVAIDGRMPFGSPVSPVLTSLVHRAMFDSVYDCCKDHGLRMSLWVDDLTISGDRIAGHFLEEVRSRIRGGGFQTHKIQFRGTARPLVLTGVPVVRDRVLAPRSLHERIRIEFANLRTLASGAEQSASIDRLLGHLGSYRYHVGPSTPEGRRAADQMHALKQRKRKLIVSFNGNSATPILAQSEAPIDCAPAFGDEPPWVLASA
jgi:RNA-directed DNA polymerase